ncbi:hypothetical protein Q672_09875 [Marinobacter sp. EVN1]|uniref:hypothetical protein n=1 Tax=Marinobacter sp. EVN1 TaxID=1397532 RepID=UPI0003B8BD9F|nr:hypothetical protein [Marinobacter sp. EVN1]ERS81608.1 hypothetical protein Q672_09875 [Marinobacter sp. EVN1]
MALADRLRFLEQFAQHGDTEALKPANLHLSIVLTTATPKAAPCLPELLANAEKQQARAKKLAGA